MATETQEIERKFEAAPGTILPRLDGLPRVVAVSGARAQTLTAEYYDTGDLRLIRAGITLRRRVNWNGWCGGARAVRHCGRSRACKPAAA